MQWGGRQAKKCKIPVECGEIAQNSFPPFGKNSEAFGLRSAKRRAKLIVTNEERSVRANMFNNFMGLDVDDMIFGSAEQIVSER